MDNLFLLIPFGLVVIALTRHFTRSYKGSANYPPGPKPWPIIGNALDIPSARAWEVYSDWCRSYGQDLVHLQVLGQHIMIVNSREMARELFEKRSLIYADRPYVPMIELMGWADNGFAFLPYGDTWRQHRRLFQEGFRDSDSAEEYLSVQSKKIQEFLTNLFNDPDSFRSHIRTLTGAIIMGIVYGHEVASSDDYFLDLAEKANETLLTVSTSSATVVNMFPFLRHFPGWLPGCKFQRIAREARDRIADMVEKPYSLVVDQLNSGLHRSSVLSKHLDRYIAGDNNEQELLTIKRVCAIAYGAGADTTISSLASFFLAMATHPHVQKKAQEHIDNLLGGRRLPTWEDRSQLQYIEAIMRECFRWRPVAPLGLFHATSTDDMVNGFFVPKGTVISGNVWAMTRDPTVYTDPERFFPERFLTEDGSCNSDEVSFIFGFGRRICPGRPLATSSVWATMACVLALFDIGKAKDGAGNVIELDDVEYTEGLVVQPVLFPCTITPRSDGARAQLTELAEQI